VCGEKELNQKYSRREWDRCGKKKKGGIGHPGELGQVVEFGLKGKNGRGGARGPGKFKNQSQAGKNQRNECTAGRGM